MKNKNLVIGIIIAAVLVLAVIFIARPGSKKSVKKPMPMTAAPSAAAKAKAAVPAKKPISKDMGGLTVKIVNSDNKSVFVRISAFKSENSRTDIYENSFVTNKMQELQPGTYDIEIDTVPQTIYKNVNVSLGKETIEDLGCITGSVSVRALDSKKRETGYPVRVIRPKSEAVLAAGYTNRAIDLVEGTYDVEIGTLPKQIKRNVQVVKGKKTELAQEYDAGTLSVRAYDENKKDVKVIFLVKQEEGGDNIASGLTKGKVGLLKGNYIVEVMTNPRQIKKDVKIEGGEETVVEFLIQPPPVSSKVVAAKDKNR